MAEERDPSRAPPKRAGSVRRTAVASGSGSAARPPPRAQPSRASRRLSAGPYSRPEGEGSTAAPPVASSSSAVGGSRRVSGASSSRGEARREPVTSGSGTRRRVAEIAEEELAGPEDKLFQLIMRQQPEVGCEAGLKRVTLGRLPIVPAPVVQVIVRDKTGSQIDIELPYLICSCTLRTEDGQSTPDTPDVTFSALLGDLVRNAHRVTDLEGHLISVFVFEDMSVRMKGRFTLEFRLGEARRPKSPRLAAVTSDPFDVVSWEDYPGRPADATLTPLSRHLHSQNVPMYIPPLVLSTETEPPPAGSNPFPPPPPGYASGSRS